MTVHISAMTVLLVATVVMLAFGFWRLNRPSGDWDFSGAVLFVGIIAVVVAVWATVAVLKFLP